MVQILLWLVCMAGASLASLLPIPQAPAECSAECQNILNLYNGCALVPLCICDGSNVQELQICVQCAIDVSDLDPLHYLNQLTTGCSSINIIEPSTTFTYPPSTASPSSATLKNGASGHTGNHLLKALSSATTASIIILILSLL